MRIKGRPDLPTSCDWRETDADCRWCPYPDCIASGLQTIQWYEAWDKGIKKTPKGDDPTPDVRVERIRGRIGYWKRKLKKAENADEREKIMRKLQELDMERDRIRLQ